MPILLCLLLLIGSAWAQHAKPEPYKVGEDVMGESLQTFLANHPQCHSEESGPSPFIKGQMETSVECSAISLQAIEEPFKKPDLFWKHVPVVVLSAAFLEKDGLSQITVDFPRSDYSVLKSELVKELGEPKDSRLNDETLVWENDTSRIDMQHMSGPSDNTSSAIVQQVKYAEAWMMQALKEQVDRNNKKLKAQEKE